MLLRNYGVYLGQQHERGCMSSPRKAKRIESVFEKKLRGAIGEAAPGNFHNAIVGRDQHDCGGGPLAGNVGRDPAAQTPTDQSHATWIHTRLQTDPVINPERIGQDSTFGGTTLRAAVAPVVEK